MSLTELQEEIFFCNKVDKVFISFSDNNNELVSKARASFKIAHEHHKQAPKAHYTRGCIVKHKFITIISVFVIFAQTIFAADYVTNQADKYDGIEVSIRYYNKTVYYPDGTEDNPINVHITIANKSTDTFRFKLSDDRMFSIDFNAFTARNAKLEQQMDLTRKRTTSRTVYFREITLESGEEYSFTENLKDYIKIETPAVYYFEVNFYPELYKSKQNFIVSNRLSLDVRSAPTVVSSKVSVSTASAEILKPEPKSPDKVVEETIIARQRDLWDYFFLYFDVEQMFMNNDAREQRYRNASEEERIRMIENYKATLMQDRIDTDIVAIPESFFIEKTEYSQTEGSVTVLEWFNEETFTRRKRYTYYVRQRDGIWQIYNYDVTNLESE